MIKNKKLFEEYSVAGKSFFTRFKQPRSLTILFTAVVGIFLFILFYNNAMGGMSLEELEESLRVVRNDTKWVDKEISPGEVKIVPSISLKVKNVGTRPLKHINFVGVFNFVESGKRLGDGNAYVFDAPLNPGEISKEITIRSKFGYKASTKSAFAENEKEWKPVRVNLFAKTRAGFLELGKYQVKQVIAGFERDSKASHGDEETGEVPLQALYMDSKWLDKKVTRSKAVVIPSVTIKLKNVGKEPLRNVYLKAVFELKNSGETFGEGFLQVLKRGLAPGETSKDFVIKSDFGGYTARSKADFIKNRQLWDKVKAKVFVKIGDSDFIHLGTYHVRQALEGVRVIYKIQ